MLFKVCGMRDASNIRAAESLGIDLMGFICWQRSRRAVTSVPSYLPVRCKRVGVFVDPDLEEVMQWHSNLHFDYIQLHGKDSPRFCTDVRTATGCGIIKAFSLSSPDDIRQTTVYHDVADMFLFDTKCPGVGGSGCSFDWNILQEYHAETPFILAGGIGPDSVDQLRRFSHPSLAGIDLNSRFETSPGQKDIALLRTFLEAYRGV